MNLQVRHDNYPLDFQNINHEFPDDPQFGYGARVYGMCGRRP